MTTGLRTSLEQRVSAALQEELPRIPVILGLCGAGRTTLLHRLEREFGADSCQYVNVERTATTPERFLKALTESSPFKESCEVRSPSSPREAFDAVLGFLSSARRPDGAPVTFLLDEVMEFRTFESFPGLRRALPEVLAVLASTPNRFALTSRYITRSERALASASPHYLLMPVPSVPLDEVAPMLGAPASQPSPVATDNGATAGPESGVALTVHRLSAGRPAYARALADTIAQNGTAPGGVLSSMSAALMPGGRLANLCGHCYELRLHRARGYGALKAVLEILAEEEPLTLTEISHRLGRTPGSTKDYLSWLDDVDLVSVQQKRYRFRDPLLRVWCRLHCRCVEPRLEDVTREVQAYAAACGGVAAGVGT